MKSGTAGESFLTHLLTRTRLVRLVVCAAPGILLTSCGDSPTTCFDRAVLNANMIHDFAGAGMGRQLESPSVKLTDVKTGASAPITRKEVVDDKISFAEQSLARARQLKQTDDNREMVQASIALFEYVLPVYRDDYQRLAQLYDGGAPRGAIKELSAAIATKYGSRFRSLADQLTAAGKAYADRHDIKVVWDVQTSPSQ